jgi:hypothetical protein
VLGTLGDVRCGTLCGWLPEGRFVGRGVGCGAGKRDYSNRLLGRNSVHASYHAIVLVQTYGGSLCLLDGLSHDLWVS